MLLVDVVEVVSRSVDLSVAAQGTVTPRTQTTLVSEVSGQILDVSEAFVSGGFFNKGDVLIRVDARNYRAELKRAEAAVATARMEIAREQGLAAYAKADWEKFNRTEVATDLALHKPQLVQARANLASARAELEKKRGDLERTVIRAPYDGMIRSKLAVVGQFVAAGTQMARIFAVDVVEVRLPLPDRDLPHIDLEAEPAVEFSASIGGVRHSWQGTIVRTEGVFDELSRVLYAVAQVIDPYNRRSKLWGYPLRVGTFVDAEIAGHKVDDIVVLPRSVLRSGNRIWTIGENSELAPRTVDLLRADENYIYVRGGLEGVRLVCLTMIENPLPGTIVRFDQGISNGN